MGERRGTRGLELWCRKMTEGYPGVKIENMTTSWRDGLGFCAIIHHFRPDLIDFSKLNKDDIYHNNELAFTVAEQHLGIPALLEPEDMVEFPVPDRLSILTYLSQFYQAFAVGQGSPSRIVPKRQSNASERGIVSPTSTSPPTKVALRGSASIHREPCAKCNLPVFIAERLNVGKLLFHRTCFRCARCSNQLTLSNYYETENNEYCCETCPDEEVIVKEETPEEKFVWSRPLSDEEKSANLKLDDYSSKFETALEELSENFNTKARSDFVQSQLEDWESEEPPPPELPATKPPDIKSVSDVDENKCISDSDFPATDEPIVNSVVSDNQLEIADKDSQDVVTKEESRSDENAAENVIVIDDSVITISDTSSSKIESNPFEYPDDLNPFGDDEEEEDTEQKQTPPPPPPPPTTTTKTNYDSSLNPFGSDDDDENQEQPAPSPKPRVKKKIKPPPEDKEIPAESPFKDDEEDEKEPSPSPRKKVIPAPRITLTPFWTDDDQEQSASDKPVPLPRSFKGDTTPKSGGPAASAPGCGSNTSLATLTGKKKKPAPPPPTSDVESPFSSLTSSPSHSVQHSPGQTLRLRKTRRAPLPPLSSTPLSQKTENKQTDIEVSPVVARLSETSEWENEKLLKDEENRTRQSLSSVSIPNKSMYGKWKRKKGPAPSRPVPQRRTIKSLPIAEIRRELDLIEVQQQGLERQGVKLEQIIREKTEASNGAMDAVTSAEVEDMILQLFEIVNEKNELFRKQAELMYLRRQQRLEEEHANVEYQIRCLMLTPEANKTDLDKAKEEELINRLVEIVERRNEIVECLEMDRVREAEENDSINKHLNMYTSKREEEKLPSDSPDKSVKKEKKKFKKKFKLKGIKGG